MKKSMKSAAKNKSAKNELIAQAGMMAEKYGVTRIAGELAMLLFLSPGPMSIGEMAEALGVSKPSVSTNIRFLEMWRVVNKAPVRNDRRDFYEFSDDLWAAARAAFEMVFRRDARSLLSLLENISSDKTASDPAMAMRIKQAAEIFRAVDVLAESLFAQSKPPQAPIREIPVE